MIMLQMAKHSHLVVVISIFLLSSPAFSDQQQDKDSPLISCTGPSPGAVYGGTSFNIYCNIQGVENYAVMWLRNGQPRESGGCVRVVGANMTVGYCTAEDTGQYVLEVISSQHVWHSKPISITVIGSQFATCLPATYERWKGTALFLQCLASAGPLKKHFSNIPVTWTVDTCSEAGFTARSRSRDDSCLYQVEGWEVFVEHVNTSHAGTYTCTAANMSMTTHIIVKVPLVWQTQLPTRIELVVDEELAGGLNCSISELSEGLTVLWYKRGEQGITVITNSLTGPTWALLEVHDAKASDTASYECRASNIWDSSRQTVYLHVLEHLNTSTETVPHYVQKTSTLEEFNKKTVDNSPWWIDILLGCILGAAIVLLLLAIARRYVQHRITCTVPHVRLRQDSETSNILLPERELQPTIYNPVYERSGELGDMCHPMSGDNL